MSLCVALQVDGTLVPTGQPVAECSGYVLVSAAEHGVYEVVNQALAMPTPEQAAAWFVGTAGWVLFWFVAARMVGSVASFFNK